MKRQFVIYIAIFLFLFVLIAAAHAKKSESLKKGEELYQTNCSVCHGDKGDGNTWVSGTLSPKPRNFTDPKVKEGLTRKRMHDTISNGRPGTAMQGFKTQLSEAEINLIIDYISATFIEAKKKK